MDLDDDVPDHSTLSQLRRRKFKDTEIFQEIFDEVVRRCMVSGLVDGKLLLTDSTHVKANVCETKREVITVKEEPSAYMKRVEKLAQQEGLIPEPKKPKPSPKEKTKEITKSTSDPDAGILNRPGKPVGFHFLSHNTIDGNSGIITDVHVTPANEKDSTTHSKRIQAQINKFGFKTEEIGADAGYDSGEIHSDMLVMNIKTYIPEAIHTNQYSGEVYSRRDFVFDKGNNQYICPKGCVLQYKCFNKATGAKVYRSSCVDCKNCPLKEKCCKGKKRAVEQPYHQAEVDIQRKNNGTARYNEIMKKRQIWCEGNNSHQKARHCLSRAKMRGIPNVREQCLLSSCALNLKRLVKQLKKMEMSSVLSTLFVKFAMVCANFSRIRFVYA